MKSYLMKRLQCCYNINNSLSKLEKTYAGVPKGSILDSLLSNIFTNDILLFRQKCSLASYADDSTM